MPRQALIVVDIQNDFVPGGALPVANGDDVVPVANRLIDVFRRQGALIGATQDWHPANHISFASQHAGKRIGDVVELDGLHQELWPDHCVQDTPGAEIVANLNRAAIQFVVKKGTDPRIDSYSGFFDNERKHRTDLEDILRRSGVTAIYLVGVATEYCVKYRGEDRRCKESPNSP